MTKKNLALKVDKRYLKVYLFNCAKGDAKMKRVFILSTLTLLLQTMALYGEPPYRPSQLLYVEYKDRVNQGGTKLDEIFFVIDHSVAQTYWRNTNGITGLKHFSGAFDTLRARKALLDKICTPLPDEFEQKDEMRVIARYGWTWVYWSGPTNDVPKQITQLCDKIREKAATLSSEEWGGYLQAVPLHKNTTNKKIYPITDQHGEYLSFAAYRPYSIEPVKIGDSSLPKSNGKMLTNMIVDRDDELLSVQYFINLTTNKILIKSKE